MSIRRQIQASICAALLVAPLGVRAEPIGGVEFPEGAVSFVDAVVEYAPGFVGINPSLPHRGAVNAVGVPNYNSDNSCASQAVCTFVSLGDGGSITLRFVNNLLTGSGTVAPDLWIFEVGPDVEAMSVEISKDGVTYFSVGSVGGATAGVNIDAFGFGIADQFAFVRLTDNPLAGGQSGATVGADIDAVGAISTVRVDVPVPEPATLALLGLGLAGLAASRRRKQT